MAFERYIDEFPFTVGSAFPLPVFFIIACVQIGNGDNRRTGEYVRAVESGYVERIFFFGYYIVEENGIDGAEVGSSFASREYFAGIDVNA